jgi:import inner membrane translocase subunit TIM21
LGDPKKITAYGEVNEASWRKNRPVRSTVTKDQYGTEHMMMHFYVGLCDKHVHFGRTDRVQVEGPLDRGLVRLHMIKKASETEFVYKYLFVDVPGQSRIYLENADANPNSSAKSKTKIFGINWK